MCVYVRLHVPRGKEWIYSFLYTALSTELAQISCRFLFMVKYFLKVMLSVNSMFEQKGNAIKVNRS